jgi:ABC-2 type transport system permease protein
MSGKEPVLDVKSTGSYEATLADRLVSNYFKVLKMYSKFGYSETELLDQVKEKLIVDVDSEVVSSLDVDALSSMAFYFNFESYSIIACLVYIISLILSIFNSDKIRKRTIISSIDYKKNNRILFLSNCIYSFLVWVFYTLIALILFKGSMFTYAGLIFSLNSLLFTMCITALAFMIGNLVHNKDALNGITNVLAIGSSFLCGAFVPVDYLPDGVLSFAHVLPTYYYINTNELLINIEKYNFDSLLPIIWNSIFILVFMFIFIIMSNFISRCRRKFG